MKKRRKVNLLVILSIFICLVFVTLNSVKFKFLLEVISPMSVFIDIYWVYDLGIWISIWLVVFFNGKYPQIPMKLRKEIFIYITENYTGLEPFEYSPEMENKGKWRLLFEEQTLDPKEIGYHIQFIKDMFLLFFTIWFFKVILTSNL